MKSLRFGVPTVDKRSSRARHSTRTRSYAALYARRERQQPLPTFLPLAAVRGVVFLSRLLRFLLISACWLLSIRQQRDRREWATESIVYDRSKLSIFIKIFKSFLKNKIHRPSNIKNRDFLWYVAAFVYEIVRYRLATCKTTRKTCSLVSCQYSFAFNSNKQLFSKHIASKTGFL